MPITPFIEGEFFTPELIEAMRQAPVDACQTLGLKDKDDAVVEILAKRIIAQARHGIHDRALLKAAALKGSEN